MYQIEKDIPIPFHKAMGGIPTYPFCDMKVGNSFLIPINPLRVGSSKEALVKEVARVRANVSTSATAYRKGHNSKARFITRIDSNEIGVRVWRIV